MSKMQMTRGKFNNINACADKRGVIAAAAMDQRGSLQNTIAKARGAEATAEDLTIFKTAVTKILTPHASALLMDPEYGLPALKAKSANAGTLLAYEKSGYDITTPGRLPDLLPEWSARRLKDAGANGVKILLYYNPFHSAEVNTIKQAFIERVGAECTANDVPLFLEPIYYEEDGSGVSALEMAKRKPEAVTRYIEEFSKDRYNVDILKIEVPFNIKFVKGSRAFAGEAAYDTKDVAKMFKESASAARRPFIFLSAGVSDDVFIETLEYAADAGTKFSGVLCGRATWQDGIPVYAKQGVAALEEWLSGKGVENITRLNNVLAKAAHPWWEIYGGKDQIDVIG